MFILNSKKHKSFLFVSKTKPWIFNEECLCVNIKSYSELAFNIFIIAMHDLN